MSVKEIIDKEGRLLNIINEVSPLVWRRYQQRYPEIWVRDHFEKIDRSSYPPYVSFRFENENKNILIRLNSAIKNYSGRIQWILDEHKRFGLDGSNWTIRPSKMSEENYILCTSDAEKANSFYKYKKCFGPMAYDELELLTNYIAEVFSDLIRKDVQKW